MVSFSERILSIFNALLDRIDATIRCRNIALPEHFIVDMIEQLGGFRSMATLFIGRGPEVQKAKPEVHSKDERARCRPQGW